jgi:hypothetical protein
LLRVDSERSFRIASTAKVDFDFARSVLVEGTEDFSAFVAVKFDVFELREYS